MPKARKPPKVSRTWRKLLGEIPGYDPFRDAGDCWFDPDAGQRVIDFFHELLTHVKGAQAGKPFRLERWQQAIVANLFGWKRPDGYRRYREAFIFVPRKNGKTPLAAGICLFVLFCDNEPGAEIYSAAADKDQASKLYEYAVGMVRNEPVLQQRARIYEGYGQRSIVYDAENSSYKVLSSDAHTKHGGNTHLALVDELHAQPSCDLLDVIETSTASEDRKQPLLIEITTSDFERESICNEKHAYASNVRDGVINDPTFLPVIYEAPRDADYTDPKVWAAANPNLGVSVSREYMERQSRKAKDSPRFRNTFKRLHLNVRTEQAVLWIPMEKWDAITAPVDPEELRGQPCYAGLDLASSSDLTAFTLLFPQEDGFKVLPFFWCPADVVEQRKKRERLLYQQWIDRGLIRTTEGDTTDYAVVRRDINELADLYGIQEIAVDRIFQGAQLAGELQGDGFEVISFGQGFLSMAAPTLEFERLIKAGKLEHGGHPVLRWMAAGAAVEEDAAGNIKPTKAKSSRKIDGIVTTIMALGRSMVADIDGGSVYEQRGLTTI